MKVVECIVIVLLRELLRELLWNCVNCCVLLRMRVASACNTQCTNTFQIKTSCTWYIMIACIFCLIHVLFCRNLCIFFNYFLIYIFYSYFLVVIFLFHYFLGYQHISN